MAFNVLLRMASEPEGNDRHIAQAFRRSNRPTSHCLPQGYRERLRTSLSCRTRDSA